MKELWDECLETNLIPDVKGRIVGVKTLMFDYKIVFGLHLSERILKITDNLSKTLQGKSMSAAEGQLIVKSTVQH